MEIKDLKDFYIDLDGDIKASADMMTATFVTDTEKLNSKYIIADNLDQIKDDLKKVRPEFNLDIEIFKQYAIKTDKNGNIRGIKLFVDYHEVGEGTNILLKGIEFIGDKIFTDYYFTGTKEAVAKLIEDNKLVYKVMDYETHSPILYAIKYEMPIPGKETANGVVNFKTYYVKNEMANMYNNEIASFAKENLRFK